ncbi:histidine--tRNA ligase [Candidatus Acetothermia bacterium]|nr:histidine--tRNA ligase [Candidatus Acetothermia bacterium]MCI2427468.1 histidine--tRNA ligase [Candidatus Acetothermia bacterium]MCI2428490.1 histidine--tRNA ligase [Candidatus Acetothermia bacterium]
MKYRSVRGMNDILPAVISQWQVVEEKIRELMIRYRYHEIRPPLLEYTELFKRGIGEDSDLVGKEMYTFSDKRGRSLTLRPEATASVVRAYLEHNIDTKEPLQKLYYLGPMFRYEKPQKGRSRQFHQYGVEAIGSLDPALDVEVIDIAWALLEELGLSGLSLRLNSIGCRADFKGYRQKLKEYFATRLASICENCRQRYQTNPLRILDCKKEECRLHIQSAPASVDYLCSECSRHFSAVRNYLNQLNLTYVIDPHLVRGLDYYTRTVFELISSHLGAQDSLLGGGRYDDLVELLGGPSTPAVGFAGGMERLILVLKEAKGRVDRMARPDLFIAALGNESRSLVISLAQQLRRQNISLDIDYRSRSLRKQMTYANQINAQHLIVIGPDELASGIGNIKEMDSGRERKISLTVEGIQAAMEK